MRISDLISDVCSSDLRRWQDDDVLDDEQQRLGEEFEQVMDQYRPRAPDVVAWAQVRHAPIDLKRFWLPDDRVVAVEPGTLPSISAAYTFDTWEGVLRSEEHTSELQSLMRNSYAGF